MQAREEKLFLRVLKGALFGAAVSLVLVLLLSLCLYKEWLGVDSIAAVNTGIKVVSAAAAALLSIRRPVKYRWLTGGLAGFAYAALAYVIFSMLSGSYAVSPALLSDLGMGLLAGMLTAMIRQMLK